MKEKLSIRKNYLMLISGILWIMAGTMVMNIGVPILTKLIVHGFWYLLFAVATFLVFYIFIFSRLVEKHTNRIKSKKDDRLPFWEFFDLPFEIFNKPMSKNGIKCILIQFK